MHPKRSGYFDVARKEDRALAQFNRRVREEADELRLVWGRRGQKRHQRFTVPAEQRRQRVARREWRAYKAEFEAALDWVIYRSRRDKAT